MKRRTTVEDMFARREQKNVVLSQSEDANRTKTGETKRRELTQTDQHTNVNLSRK
jgi:hypothetical protein